MTHHLGICDILLYFLQLIVLQKVVLYLIILHSHKLILLY